jgi:flagellar biogenesis protein FliO
MSLSATFGVFVALGAVLALLVVVLRVLKRFAPHAGGGRGRLPMEVVQRLPIGPRQSIAVVRIGERVLAVAIGADGMQTLTEIEGDDRATVLDASVAPTPLASSPIALRGVASALARNQEARALPGAGWLLARLGGGAARTASAPTERQTAATSATAGAVASGPAAVGAAAVPGDAFRSVLGIALSSSTRLVGLLMVGGATLLAAPSVGAQAPTVPAAATEQAATAAAQPAAVQAPAVQGAAAQPTAQPTVQPAPAGAATTPAARQAARRPRRRRRPRLPGAAATRPRRPAASRPLRRRAPRRRTPSARSTRWSRAWRRPWTCASGARARGCG